MTCKLTYRELELAHSLCKILQKYNNTDLEINVDFNNLIHIHSDDYSVEFRYVILFGSVIVSRVQFINKNKGCMTECFNELQKHSDGWYDKVVIQAVSTYAMYSWCKKLGFNISEAAEPMEFMDENNVFEYGDYVREV